jgi:hypothetical protein
MNTQIRFSYPRRGLTGQFTTFRLGAKLGRTLTLGEVVDLVDSRTAKLLTRATVTSVFTGQLDAMAQLHAGQAHNWREYPEADRPALLVASMKKRWVPGRVLDTSVVTVIYLEEISNE